MEMVGEMNRDDEFRKWYDAREGVKSESFAYAVWCAAWDRAIHPDVCRCLHPVLCDLHDKCMK